MALLGANVACRRAVFGQLPSVTLSNCFSVTPFPQSSCRCRSFQVLDSRHRFGHSFQHLIWRCAYSDIHNPSRSYLCSDQQQLRLQTLSCYDNNEIDQSFFNGTPGRRVIRIHSNPRSFCPEGSYAMNLGMMMLVWLDT